MLRDGFVQGVEADLKGYQEVEASVSVDYPVVDQKHAKQTVLISPVRTRPAQVTNVLNDLLNTFPAHPGVGLQGNGVAQHAGLVSELQRTFIPLSEATIEPLLKRQAQACEQVGDRARRGVRLQPPE
ncbi:hypothetical protein PPUJ20066_29160 [Pseudomonas putida]|nr:hypothetical protein PPUJ20066_29160 [Pseudomonas putida]